MGRGLEQVAATGEITGFDLAEPGSDQTVVAIRELGKVHTITFPMEVTSIDWFNLRRLIGRPFYRIKRGRWRKRRRPICQ